MRSPSFQRFISAIAALLCSLVVLLFSPSAEAIDDPALDYYTITTPHFHVHYYDGLEDLARRAAIAAEESHEILSPLLDWEPASRTHMLVTDHLDRANGFARIFGRNFITIYGKPPVPEGVLGYYDDWLRVLVYHEYVHILHLDTNPGPAQWLNRIIGKQYHPNSVLPRWYVEGIAVYLESVRTGRGRVDSPLFRMWLRTAALDDDLFSLGKATGLPFQWPSGTGSYLYGAFFIEYMAQEHSENFIRDFNHEYGRRVIPFAMNHITREITGEDLDEHWDGFIASAKAEAEAKKASVEARGQTQLHYLTDGGGRNRYPVTRPNTRGEVTFHRADLTEHRVFASVSTSGGPHREIRDADGAAGPSAWSPDGKTLYFSRSETERGVYNYQDLFAYTPETGDLERLTVSDRAREPAISPDGTDMVHVRNRQGSMELVRRPLDAIDNDEVLVGRHDWPAREDGHWQQISNPVYTPEGDAVVFSWWRLDRRQRDLYRYDFDTGEVEPLTDSPAHDIDPHFGPDGLLYFASNVDDIFNIHAMDVDTGEIWQVSNVLRGVFNPQITPDKNWIYVYTYTHRGFEIARFRHPQRLRHADRRAEPTNNPRIRYPEPRPEGLDDPQPYSARPWMRPMFFEPDMGVVSGGVGVGASLRGYDPVEHHEYTLSGGWTTGPSFTDQGANLGLQYRYTGGAFNITTRARMQDFPRTRGMVGASQDIPFIERQYRGDLSLSYPIRVHDHRFSLSSSFRLEYATVRERAEFEHEPGDITPRQPDLGFFNELRFGLSYSNQSRYPHSISVERGVTASSSIGLQHPSLGHPDSAITYSYSGSFFQPNPLVDRHVFALQLRGAINRSATGQQRQYAIGGLSPQDVLQSTIFQEPRRGFPLRGYPPGLLRGDQYQVWKLEYRFPLLDFDHGFSTMPVFFRNLKGSVFADTGAAFNGHLVDADFVTGVGAEIQLDTILGYQMLNSFRLGYARGLNEGGISDWYLLFGGGF